MPKNDSRERRKRDSKKTGPLIICILFIVGVLLYYAFSQGILVLNTPKIISPELPSSLTKATQEESLQKTPEKAKFEFYNLLSQENVSVPHAKNIGADATTATIPEESKIESKKSEEKPLPAPTGVPATPIRDDAKKLSSLEKLAPVTQAEPAQSHYVLQVAALAKLSDADSMKARLALLGFNAFIQSFEHQGKTWYRVKAGPYASLAEAEKARKVLSNNHLSGMLIRT